MNTTKIRNHLKKYKENKLGIKECGKWWKNNKEYGHILPFDKKFKNIIQSGFYKQLKTLLETDSVHLGFHHLNSSQALALNLFGPLVVTKHLNLIDSNINTSKGLFEYIEDHQENTNFDFFIDNPADKNYYFEVKYTESCFGKAQDDKRHRQKYIEIYEPKLNSIANITEEEFYQEYQLWRNIIYAHKGIVNFVLPKFRDDLITAVKKTKEKIINKALSNRVRIILIDDLVERCKKVPELNEHYTEFENKYLNF